MNEINDLKIKIYADGADLNSIIKLNNNSLIKGFTTNPTLMRKAGIKNYKNFAIEIIDIVNTKPISFEVFADDLNAMEDQAEEIASWGKNVNIKIPITNTKGQTTKRVIESLSNKNIICNVTAIFTLNQCKEILEIVNINTPNILSIFAGRIADTGIDPIPLMREVVQLSKSHPLTEILWASPRELLNLFQANDSGCHIITMASELIDKMSLVNKDLDNFSLETVLMFYNDALKAGYTIK